MPRNDRPFTEGYEASRLRLRALPIPTASEARHQYDLSQTIAKLGVIYSVLKAGNVIPVFDIAPGNTGEAMIPWLATSALRSGPKYGRGQLIMHSHPTGLTTGSFDIVQFCYDDPETQQSRTYIAPDGVPYYTDESDTIAVGRLAEPDLENREARLGFLDNGASMAFKQIVHYLPTTPLNPTTPS